MPRSSSAPRAPRRTSPSPGQGHTTPRVSWEACEARPGASCSAYEPREPPHPSPPPMRSAKTGGRKSGEPRSCCYPAAGAERLPPLPWPACATSLSFATPVCVVPNCASRGGQERGGEAKCEVEGLFCVSFSTQSHKRLQSSSLFFWETREGSWDRARAALGWEGNPPARTFDAAIDVRWGGGAWRGLLRSLEPLEVA